MAETKQTAEIANIVSNEIFKHFGWERAGTSDHNFKGLDLPDVVADDEVSGDDGEGGAGVSIPVTEEKAQDQSQSTKLKDYPADVVFYYEDPYFHLRNYIHFDLKSYGASTLKGSRITKALRSLSKVIGIADSSRVLKKS
jgi:hypothetical protein